MKYRLAVIVGSLAALSLGALVAYSFLANDIILGPKVDLTVDVVYAYFGVQEFSPNVTGLWRNSTDPIEDNYHIVSYLIVLNVTNHSNESARILNFESWAAQEISVGNNYSESTENSNLDKTSVPENLSSNAPFSYSIQNAIVTDSRHITYLPFWDDVWQPTESRLIGLSGIVEVEDNAYPSLASGSIYLLGIVEGQAAYSKGGWSQAYSLKQVHLEFSVEQPHEYVALYNTIVNDNEMIRFGDGLDMFLQKR